MHFYILGEQHYNNLNAFGPGDALNDIKKRDEEKKNMCLIHGITLVDIPYWYSKITFIYSLFLLSIYFFVTIFLTLTLFIYSY